MSKVPGNIVDFVARGANRQTSITDRIHRRKAILSEWLASGIPEPKRRTLPTSLRAAREWEDSELGIIPISSPNDFTQTHPTHGDSVREISRLISELSRHLTGSAKTSHRRISAVVAKLDKNEADRQIALIASQWHTERHARQAEQKRADAAEQRMRIVAEENAELKRKLLTYEGLKVVTIE